MLTIRLFEKSLFSLYDKGLLSGTIHTYIGQDHTPFGSNLDFETEFSSEFLYSITCSGEEAAEGDINQDTNIDILDVVILVNYVMENDFPNDSQFDASDINLDGSINVLDVVLLVGIILNT